MDWSWKTIFIWGSILLSLRITHQAVNSPANVALGGEAVQSSMWDPSYPPSHVIDGRPYSHFGYGSCTATLWENNPWWKLDMRGPYDVSSIEIIRRSDCCSHELEGAEIRIGNSLENNGNNNPRCAVISVTSDVIVTFSCSQMTGRYVNIFLPGAKKRLQLCEVKVYATPHITGDHCSFASCSRDYILIHKEPKTWFEAQAYCRERYTDLATINNVQDMNRATDKMEDEFYDFWIGLYEDVVTWKWSLLDEGYYGDSEAEFRNWDVAEPNNTSGIRHCAGIRHTGEWKDVDCDTLHYFLCFDGDGAPEAKILVETKMNWTDAQHYCRQHHTDLLSVRNQAENQEIQRMVALGKLAWIGLFGDSWRWSDGSDSSFRFQWQEPADSLGKGPNCAHVYDRRWSERSCNTKSMFLCYYFKKRLMVRISADFDMRDPVIQQQILSQLQAEMKNKDISDFKIRWRTTFTHRTNSKAQL